MKEGRDVVPYDKGDCLNSVIFTFFEKRLSAAQFKSYCLQFN